jgi:hypothetical protein
MKRNGKAFPMRKNGKASMTIPAIYLYNFYNLFLTLYFTLSTRLCSLQICGPNIEATQ